MDKIGSAVLGTARIGWVGRSLSVWSRYWLRLVALDWVGLGQRCRIFFSAEKLLTPLTHSFWRLAVFFFSTCGKKKNTDQKFWNFRNFGKNLKKSEICYNWFWVSKKLLIYNVISEFLKKWWSRIYLAYFFFPKKLGRKKKIPHISLTHSFFEIFVLKLTFPGKKIRLLWCWV